MIWGIEPQVSAPQDRAGWPGIRALLATLIILLGLIVVGSAITGANHGSGLSQFFWQRQDWPMLLVLLAGLLQLRRTNTGTGVALFNAQIAPWMIWLAAFIIALLTWSGHYWLMAGYDLSRDEQMVLFDAAIIAQGDGFARLPHDWSAVGSALSRVFILPGIANNAWVSAYLPGNAALHAIGAALGDTRLAAPILAGLAIVALWDCARRLWPDDAAPQAIALLCLLLSAQFLVTATTSYAMTAHLSLNLVWLTLFLRGRWWCYALLLPIGFVATGLHQPIFHPLFVAPFLWLLVERRGWRLLAFLTIGYAAVGLFWLGWPAMVIAATGSASHQTAVEGASYLTRLIDTLGGWSPSGVWVMALNLLRFAAWQHLLLLPLVTVGVVTSWRSSGLVRALALAPLITIAVMLILLPYQGHGWGYRYLHGLIGNLCLLAGFGWLALRERGIDRWRVVALSSAASLIGLAWLGGNAHRMVVPYATIDRAIAASRADYVLIDDTTAPFAQDLVYNPPYLERRPIRLAASAVSQLRWPQSLCTGKRVAIVDQKALASINRLFKTALPIGASPALQKARARLLASGCTVIQ